MESFINTKISLQTSKYRSSETAKILENTYRAVNIAQIDEWTKFANEIKIDLLDILNAIKIRPTHSNIMQPGIGVGGYCLTKDPEFAEIALSKIFRRKKKFDFKFANLSMKVNKAMPKTTIELISKRINGKFKNKKFLIFGVSYKKNIGDTRNSPVLDLCKFIKAKKGLINYFDPYVSYWYEFQKNSLKISSLKDYDYLIFTVNHSYFNQINYNKLNLKKRL